MPRPYRFIRRKSADYVAVLPDDLSARKVAEQSTDIVRVETAAGRVVWRKPLTEAQLEYEKRRGKKISGDAGEGIDPWAIERFK